MVGSIAACSSEGGGSGGGTDGAENCVPLETLCLANNLFVCQPGGKVEFVKSCGAGEQCVDGTCLSGGDTSVGGTTTGGDTGTTDDGHGDPGGEPGGEPGGDTGGDPGGEPGGDSAGEAGGDPGGDPGGDTGGDPTVSEGACNNEQDLPKLNQPSWLEPVLDCEFQCSMKPNFFECIEECVGKIFTPECSTCVAGWIVCIETTCHDLCENNTSSPKCQDCLKAECNPPMKACSGIEIQLGE